MLKPLLRVLGSRNQEKVLNETETTSYRKKHYKKGGKISSQEKVVGKNLRGAGDDAAMRMSMCKELLKGLGFSSYVGMKLGRGRVE